ncbi:uncharacterized protein MJAP1_003404 [Malassezia japonica]|uniref:Uncharacterized protein n=1 Tax=Malassezia japonica TaxID=223818 RepID=A0AAF0F8M3_9BASI|nr:uncharacterized protein MJAP1_003404 [Malassezia japonica]WFD40418.1 hypothetical protein MJAP1_003404 [Malassezia japonica]
MYVVKTVNKSRKREYIAQNAREGEAPPKLASETPSKGPKPMSPLQSLIHNWTRQFDKK